MSTKTIREHQELTMTPAGLAAQGLPQASEKPAKGGMAHATSVTLLVASAVVLWPIYFLAGLVWVVVDFVNRERRGEYTGVPGPMVTNSMPGMTVLDPYKNWR